MYSVDCDGLSCWSDSARFLDGSWDRDVVMLSLFGNRNAVRAAWARLSGSKYGSVSVGSFHASLGNRNGDSGIRYTTVLTPTGKATVHLVIIHQAATSQVSAFAKEFYEISPHPEETFFVRLNRMCPVPFRKTWREQIWRLGRDKGLITPLPGFGMPGYTVSTVGHPADEDDESLNWSKVIQEAVGEGVLK